MKKNKLASFFLRWEFLLVVLLVLMCVVFNLQDAARVASGAARKDVFNLPNVMRGLRPYMLYSFMTMGVMLILAMGDIDISTGAIATLSVVVLGALYNLMGGGPVALVVSIIACLATGSLCGAINGFLVTRFKELFPMIITLATQLFFRGFGYLLIGGATLTFDSTFGVLSETYKLVNIFGLNVPLMVLIFLAVAVVFYVWLHLTSGGRKIFAIGTNATTARYSGIRVDAIKVFCFTLTGFMCAVTGIFFVGANSSSIKADLMDGYHMYAIAAAVLGGFSTDGGKGSVIGAVLSLFIFGIVKIGLGTLYGFADSAVNLAVGVILILSVLLPNITEDVNKYLRVRKQRAETAAAKAAN